MARRRQTYVVGFLALALCAALGGLGYRLVDLQVLRHAELKVKARENSARHLPREPRRGDILDARGNLLATSQFVKTVYADPLLIGSHQAEVARTVAPLLGLDAAEVYRKLFPTLRTNAAGQVVTNRYVVLKRKVAPETFAQVQAAMKQLTFGVDEKNLPRSRRLFYRELREHAVSADLMDDQLRVYPNGRLAAHVLGYVGMNEREYDGRRFLETSGAAGIESALNAKLTGVRGWRLVNLAKGNKEVVWKREQDVEPRDGLNVVLTIDAGVQAIVEEELARGFARHDPISATAIVVRPRTGEILAMATLPDYDPNNLGGSTEDARRNLVITDIAEPGSTFKIVVVSGALNDRKVTLRDAFHCENGAFLYGGRVLHDHHGYGLLTVEEIITKSSNIGSAKIGIQLGAARLHDYVLNFGFGQPTGILLPGEVKGIVHPPEKWSKVSIAQIPMGHGIAATRLQMAMAMAAIANQGVLMRPMLVDRLETRDGTVVAKFAPTRVRQVIGQRAAADMVQALKTVPTKGGTAPDAELEHYTVAGKTGTAQKIENGRYVRGKYLASFIGFFPADQPELCIAVVLDEPQGRYYGGQTAAPIFRDIAIRAASYLNIRPDRGEEPGGSPMFDAGPEDRSPRTASARPAAAPLREAAN